MVFCVTRRPPTPLPASALREHEHGSTPQLLFVPLRKVPADAEAKSEREVAAHKREVEEEGEDWEGKCG